MKLGSEKIRHSYRLKARNWTVRAVQQVLEEAIKAGVPSDAEIYRSYNGNYTVEWYE